MTKETKFCQNCGKEIDGKAEICVSCGVRVRRADAVKDPAIAALLSFLLIGLGQIYNGEIIKGIGYMLLGVALFLTIFLMVGILLYPVFFIYQIWDAYTVAKKTND